MEYRWAEKKAAEFIGKYGSQWGEDLALCTYSSTLIGSESSLVLHGGGNSSVKTDVSNIFGETIRAIFVKASGFNMASMEPHGYSGLDLTYLKRLRNLAGLDDHQMVNEFRTHLLDESSATPSIETLVHAFIPAKFVDHTHPDAILALTNQIHGEDLVREALGENVAVLEYFPPGFQLAKEVASEYERMPKAQAIVLMRHGLVVWGKTAKESYDRTIELVGKAEIFLQQRASKHLLISTPTPVALAEQRLVRVAPIIRGLLAQRTADQDQPWTRTILAPLIDRKALNFVDSDRGREIAATPPLTSDHLIRTKPFYLWIESPDFENPDKLRVHFSKAIEEYAAVYNSYVDRHADLIPAGVERMDPMPRVILIPGLGAICSGCNAAAAGIARDIADHTLSVKSQIAAMGAYSGLTENDLFHMEYRSLQHRKLPNDKSLPLAGRTALVTGAAGAIGSGIAQEFLEQGCHVAAADLAGDSLDELVRGLKTRFGPRIISAPFDVTDPQSAANGFSSVIRAWGGVDLVVLNAGAAHVSSLEGLDLKTFQKLEQINIEGTLIMLSECARHFKLQGTGGDIVLVSTKNVFAPGAKFGGYSATKAAGHQLARIASQEFAELDVRVNMVAPDAVFSHGSRKSGLWAQIGPDRMAARGLNSEGLEEYYRNRNLLKARVTARHVAKAVLFFAARQTPTTGATIPVDGGLPDATPR
jgi:rhamnose utilization protein RhaD (predicted bifunctional aldolase and dehydrogenase)/NAD(P)-dependent dehydrogenase (short-subunit alcohol dehydrogenase family)